MCLSTPVDYRWNLIANGDGQMHLIDASPSELEPEPSFNPEADTAFLLFTRNNPTAAQRITWTAASITNSHFVNANPVRCLIHGFNSGPSSGVNIASTREYLARGAMNVIVVDWSIGASTINYVTARNRVPQVADQLARFLNFLVSNGRTQWPRVFIAGHSLGAHIAGLTGKRTTGRVQVIWALDPAGPLFRLDTPSERFAANDAVYTEGIRTNAGDLGFLEPLAQADFYPNWGRAQPGCGIDVGGSCAHSRAHQFFAESINSVRFNARRCANFAQIQNQNCPTGQGTGVMGGDAHKTLTGVFFLTTNSNSPFAQG